MDSSPSVNTLARSIDPRVERSRLVIRQATLAELGDVGYGAFTIESVAARAGVGKSTIYRHWRSKLALITDAFESLNQQPSPNLEGGSPRQRVEQLLRHVSEAMRNSIFSRCVPALIEASQHHSEVAEFLNRYNTQRRQALIDAVAEGVANGDFPAHQDPELTALALVGPIFYRRFMSTEPFDPERVDDMILSVLGPAPTTAPRSRRHGSSSTGGDTPRSRPSTDS
jgi:TetR/AcrR family transcriptional regulator, regulator of autoinduction and epiphytic fitness